MRTELKGSRKPGARQSEEFLLTRKELVDMGYKLRRNSWELEELGSRYEKLENETNDALKTTNTGLVEKTGRGLPGSAENTG